MLNFVWRNNCFVIAISISYGAIIFENHRYRQGGLKSIINLHNTHELYHKVRFLKGVCGTYNFYYNHTAYISMRILRRGIIFNCCCNFANFDQIESRGLCIILVVY